ncbi:TonB-dependent siderophore receptor [Acinetobacter qingfengensis]|uniref:Secretin/TonB short N-terminal domain-containing protein n=1 Tax=Acinetobacter qingfengensis TaxID=1262585 RepID=A0A1E7R5B0_9GAMM|nr:TonB-dependent receptor [Acinetobacter qingfengensis]OEY94457.1 hypothetical protein BJI46_03700 [Acinetobacter qingfengensis]
MTNNKPNLRLTKISLVLATVLYAGAVFADTAHHVQIPAQRLDLALQNLAQQSGAQILFVTNVVINYQSESLSGDLTVEQALQELLKGKNLQIKKIGENKFSIVKLAVQPQYVGQLKPIDVQARGTSTNGSVAQLPAITVSTVDETRTEGNNAYTTRKATTGKFEQSLRETPQSISVMTRKQLDDQNISTLKEAMVQATGVTVTSNGAFAETGYLMRGYRAAQQQDGLSVGSDDSYSIAPARDMEIYDRVEILRGPAGLLEGSGDPSGIINMVRRRPTADAEGFVNLSYGSWNNKRVSVGANNSLNNDGSIRGRMILTHQEKDFFYDYAEENRSSAYAIVEADVSDKTLLTTAINYSQSDSIPFYGWPPHGGGFSRSSYFGADWNKTEVPQAFEGRLDLEHAFDNEWKLKFATIYQNQELNTQMGIATTPNFSTQTTSYYGYKKQSKQALYGGELSLRGKFNLFERDHDVIVGATWSNNTTKIGSSTSYDNDDRSSYWSSDYLVHPRINLNDIPSPNLNTQETEVIKSSLYGALKYKLLDDLILTVGGRFSNYDEKSRGIGSENQSAWEKSDANANMEFTPYGGLVWNFSKDLSWYLSYTDIFSPQSEKDWQGKTIKPRVGWQVETGIKGEFLDGDLLASLSLFRLRDENRATVDRNVTHYPNGNCEGDPTDSSTFGCSIAGGENQTQGIELELVGKLTDQWNVIMSYVLTDAEVISTNATDWWEYAVGSNFAAYTPKHAFKLWSTYDFENGLSVGGGVNAQSSLYDSTTGQHNGGFTIFNTHVGYKVNPQIDIALNVNNLFDKSYFAGMGYAANRWMYGEPRNFMLTLRAKY